MAGIDGQPFDEGYGLALTGNSTELWWQPRCAGMVRSYRITESRIVFGPRSDLPPRKPGDPTPPVCTIGLPARLQDVFRALDAAESVTRTPQNGIELSGGGHSVLLFSQ